MSRAATAALVRERSPDPWHGWVRFAPARWPGPAEPWIDLAEGCLGKNDGEPDVLTALAALQLDGVLYVPPVATGLSDARDRLVAQQTARGTPVVAQLVACEEPTPALAAEGVTIVWDLLGAALDGRESSAVFPGAKPGRGSAVLWPLLSGLGDDVRVARLADVAATAGVGALQAVPVELSGRERRELGETLDEARYLQLFHGEPPAATVVARAAARRGLAPILGRPLPRPPLRGAANLRLAGLLAECGELCLLAGETESRAHALLRAARFAERGEHDLVALAREGNLGVIPWLEAEARDLVVEAAAGGEPRLRRELIARLAA